jgi:lipoyl(octanoyl) transferase
MILQSPSCELRFFGVEPYETVWRAMQDFVANREPGTPDELWVLQHQPVFTQGQTGKPEHVLSDIGIPVVRTDRGGQVTYHGPGQLVIYFLVDVKRRGLGVRSLVDLIEQSILQLLTEYHITGELQKGAPGVYVQGKKIAALGLRIRRGSSYHGLSLNIDMDLAPFSAINPCGYAGLQVTQLADLVDVPREGLLIAARDRLLAILQTRLESPACPDGNCIQLV